MEKININEFTFQWNKEIKEYKNNKGNKCINEFEIVKKIDEGAVWKVYKVIRYYYDENKKIMTKTYALKRTHIMTQYKRRYFKNEEMISYLDEVFNEIEILGRLHKDNSENSQYVVTLFEVLYDEERNFPFLYLVTDFCDLGPIMGRDQINFNHFHNVKLINHFIGKYNEKNIKIETEDSDNNLVKKHFLPLSFKHKIAKKIFKEILMGLLHIHSCNISHRDIKMENILYNSVEDKIKIIDFSISTIIHSNKTLINEPGGSMHYQSPEMFTTEETKGYYEPKATDIYAVGVCLYIFIFEQFPFDDESELCLQMKILNEKLQFPFDPKNEDYVILLKALMEKDPHKRPKDINEILNYSYLK